MWLDQEMWLMLQNIVVAAHHMRDNFTTAACGA
jgi:hypothetical protein